MSGAENIDLLQSAIWTTLQVATIGVLLILPAGVGLGYVLARASFPGRSLVQTLIALPMVVPPVAVGLVLLQLLSRKSPIGHFLTDVLGLQIVFTRWGAILAAAVMSFPLLVRGCEAAFVEVPLRYEQAARTLGATRWRTFWQISLPMARRGVSYGVLLAFARALGEFGATVMVAGNIPGESTTLSLGIYTLFDNGRDAEAMTFMLVAVALAFVPILVGEVWLRRRR